MTVLIAALFAQPALAQDAAATGVNGHGFHPAPIDRDIRDPILVQRPGAFRLGDVFLGTLLEYSDRSLIDTEGVLIDELFALNTSFGVAVHDMVRLSAGAPLIYSSVGPDGFQGTSIGDTRIETMVVPYAPSHILEGGGFGFGINMFLDLPTGVETLNLGDPGVGGGGMMAVTYELGLATFTADAGVQGTPRVEGITGYTGGPSAILGASIGTMYSNYTAIHAEIRALPPFGTSDIVGRGTPAEAALSLRTQPPEGFHLIVGGSLGLTDAPGTAYSRVFAGLGGSNMIRPRRDSDPLATVEIRDNCPLEPETYNDWLDDDGCPDELASLAVTVVYAGRPLPGSVVDLSGPNGVESYTVGGAPITVPQAVPGTRWRADAKLGECLKGSAEDVAAETGTELVVIMSKYEGTVLVDVVDPDGNLLPDASVEWTSGQPLCVPESGWVLPGGRKTGPVGVGTHQVTVTAPGYTLFQQTVIVEAAKQTQVRAVLEPTLVRVEKERIVIMDKIHFETGKAVIKPESFGLLNDVAMVIVDNEHVGRVEIAGHTDSRGSDEFNLDLSQRRAESVRTYLIGQGVDPARLVAKGFGEIQPIDTNATKTGRAANRRVEFNLIDQAEAAP